MRIFRTTSSGCSSVTASFRLDGRVAVVSGASGRLGPHWVRAVVDAGASVLALDLEAQEPWAGPGRVVVGQADVTNRASLESALAFCESELGAPTILVNNAGIDAPPGSGSGATRIEEVDADDFRRTLEVNLVGAFLAAQVFGPAIAEAGGGSIVNIGSLYASIAPEPAFYDHLEPPFLKPPAYGASKAGLVQLSRTLARAWGDRGVRVNTLSPGGILGDQDELFKDKFSARVPLGRLGRAEELGGALVFLASDASSYVTGIELRIDGGFTA
jgi:NAD(P)-dependent dehydrogenase (short-subunit alcohol dehydrogenase family)